MEKRRKKSGNSILRACLVAVSVILQIGWLLVMLFPKTIFSVFSSDEAMLAIGPQALNTYFFGFVCMAFQFAGQSTFLALGRAKMAICFALLRKVVIVVPLTLLLPRLGLGVYGVFLAEPISNALGGMCCFTTMYLTVYRKLGKRRDDT